MKNVLLTGSNGIIGRDLVKKLQSKNINLFRYNRDGLFNNEDKLIATDLTSIPNIHLDVIIHTAWSNAHQLNSFQNLCNNQDLDLLSRIIKLCKSDNCLLIFFSSIEVLKLQDIPMPEIIKTKVTYSEVKKIAEDTIIEKLSNFRIYRLVPYFGKTINTDMLKRVKPFKFLPAIVFNADIRHSFIDIDNLFKVIHDDVYNSSQESQSIVIPKGVNKSQLQICEYLKYKPFIVSKRMYHLLLKVCNFLSKYFPDKLNIKINKFIASNLYFD